MIIYLCNLSRNQQEREQSLYIFFIIPGTLMRGFDEHISNHLRFLLLYFFYYFPCFGFSSFFCDTCKNEIKIVNKAKIFGTSEWTRSVISDEDSWLYIWVINILDNDRNNIKNGSLDFREGNAVMTNRVVPLIISDVQSAKKKSTWYQLLPPNGKS